MRRVAIFTEGLTEQIFTREFLFRMFDASKIKFECYELLSHELRPSPYNYPNRPNVDTEIFFMIVQVHGDEGVLSAIKERERHLIEKGKYDIILGLRDMYSDAYHRMAKGVIKNSVTKRLIDSHAMQIEKMTYSDKIKICYAIMEIEAWFIGMYNLFHKIDPVLTVNYINEKLGIDLKAIDPQLSFYKPSEYFKSILSLNGKKYNKTRSDVEAICAHMDLADIDDAIRDGRCSSFAEFCREIVV